MSFMTRPDSLFVGPPGDDDRYELLRACGEGGEGQVYEGQFAVEGHPQSVAIKVGRQQHEESDADFRARAEVWQAQIRIVQSIRHTSIVGMRETFIGLTPHRLSERPTSQAVYLAMLWVEGPNLSTWAADNPTRNFRSIKDILISIAAGLSHLHIGVDTGGRAIFHRDVKPSNVIITADHRVVLVDFGLALGEARMPAGGGTPGYIAPEVRRSGAFSAASDLYGLAAIAFFLITGRHPSDEDTIDTFRRDLDAAPFVAHLPLLSDAVLAGLQPEPADRPVSVAAWARQLEGAGSTSPYPGGDLPPPAPEVPPAPPPPEAMEVDEQPEHPGRRRLAVLAATALLAALLGAFILSLNPRGSDEQAGNLGVAPTVLNTTTTTLPPTTSTSSTSTSTSTSTTLATTTTAAEPAPPQDSFLSDLEPAETSGVGASPQTGLVKINGVSYAHGVTFSNSFCRDKQYADYDLSRTFSTFRAKAGLPDTGRSDSPVILIVYLDGRNVFEKEFQLGQAADLNLNVSGKLRIRFETTRVNPKYCPAVALGDPLLSK